MRTTIRISDELLRKAKLLASDSGRTLTAVIEDALRETLGRRARPARRKRLRLTTFRGNGVRAGIDLHDSAALLEVMAGADAAG